MRDFFGVALAQTGIPPGIFVPPGPRWIEIEVGGNLLGPRAQLISVPYAYHASSATNADTAAFATQAGSVVSGGAGSIPAGAILPFAGPNAPAGFLLCDGSAVSRFGITATLFSIIGTAYGAGDGSTTFNLPDLRGRVILGPDNMGM